VHRIGRVGRAGREGVAITLAEPREQRFLRNIEQFTKRKIDIAKVPTVADLRAKRLEALSASLRETLVQGELDHFRVVVESLAAEFDPMDIALAAVKLAQDATGVEAKEEKDIPQLLPHGDKLKRERGPARPRAAKANVTRLYIGAGRADGVRPQDLVGAITGEAGINGRDIGAIDIAERFSIVEVADKVAGSVIKDMRGSTIKGKKVIVRRDREGER
jgi:ATP-dependent RNA helicase DeaD